MIMFILAIIIAFTIYFIKKKQYEKTEYYLQTKIPYGSVRFDKGRLGEFYTYKYLLYYPINNFFKESIYTS